jgi:ubiquinone/menaquinone biosynthesis C-methylase UbiE
MLGARLRRARNKKMNKMETIYQQQANLYDLLVSHEDHNNNRVKFLNTKTDFTNKTVCEFGVGTGRVTKTYIEKIQSADLFDRSIHMLEQTQINLKNYMGKITINELDNKNIDQIVKNYDISIEGWSFGHLISENADTVEYWSNKIIDELKRISKTIIIIETMGTNCENPFPPNTNLKNFYMLLRGNGFNEYIINTDYKFENSEQAQYILGSFFGEQMKEEIRKNNLVTIKEFTGIWIL